MIAKLTGRIDSVGAGHVILDVAGVGYLVFCGERTLKALGEAGEVASLAIETHMREDHIHLYGFIGQDERALFRSLQSVQGVGARVALSLLDALGAEGLVQAVETDAKSLSIAPGVGAKLAARIAGELRGKLRSPANPAKPATASALSANHAVSALVNLGYARAEAFAAVTRAAQMLDADAAIETLVRASLKELAA